MPDYLDAYLVHTPYAFLPGEELDPRDENGQVIYDAGISLIETWRALEELVESRRCRSIGLFDITLDKLKEIVTNARVMPAIVQVNPIPTCPNGSCSTIARPMGSCCWHLRHWATRWTPTCLHPVITGIADRVNKTPAQVALAWRNT